LIFRWLREDKRRTYLVALALLIFPGVGLYFTALQGWDSASVLLLGCAVLGQVIVLGLP